MGSATPFKFTADQITAVVSCIYIVALGEYRKVMSSFQQPEGPSLPAVDWQLAVSTFSVNRFPSDEDVTGFPSRRFVASEAVGKALRGWADQDDHRQAAQGLFFPIR